jgi:hypothetical protein
MGWLGWLFRHRFKITKAEAEEAMLALAKEKGWAIGPLSIDEQWTSYIGDAVLLDVEANLFNPQPMACFLVNGDSGEVDAMRSDQLDFDFE